MNTTHISHEAQTANIYLNNFDNNYDKDRALSPKDVIHFPVQARVQKQPLKGWICNLSAHYVFSQQHHEYLQIQPSQQHSQFALICKLLKANTCRVIYFDDQLSQQQLTELRERHITSRTELIHAKLAFLFAKEVSTLYA